MSADDDLSVAVIGPGAIGLVAVAGLLDAGRRPLIAARSGFDQLVVRTMDGEQSHTVDVMTDPAEVAAPADVVFLATKVHQSEGATDWIRALCGPETVLAALQNGIDHRARLGRHVDEGRVAPIVVNLPAERLGPGRVAMEGKGVFTAADDIAGQAVAAALAGSFLKVHLVDDWLSHAWFKLLINSSLGILGVLTGAPNGVVAEPDAGALLRALIDEAALVGRAEGATIPEDVAQMIIDRVLTNAPGHRSSIAADRLAGRPTEWEARNKVVVDLAERHGIDVPLNRAGTTLIRLGEPD